MFAVELSASMVVNALPRHQTKESACVLSDMVESTVNLVSCLSVFFSFFLFSYSTNPANPWQRLSLNILSLCVT